MVALRPRYRAHSPGVTKGANGLPVFTVGSGGIVPIALATPPLALHSDPSFEDPSLAAWNFFWQNGGCTAAANTSDTLEAEQSLTVNVAAGVGSQQIVESDAFAVNRDDVLEVSVWARAVSGAPTISLGVLMSASDSPPDFFGAATDQGELSPPSLLPDSFTQYRGTFAIKFGVASGEARVFFRVKSDDDLAAVARLDFTTSAVVGTTATAPA